jgi:hypothetical protein
MRRWSPLDESWSGVNRWKSDGSHSRGAGAWACARAGGRPDRCRAGRAGYADACVAGQSADALPGGRADRCRAGGLTATGIARSWRSRGRAFALASAFGRAGRTAGRAAVLLPTDPSQAPEELEG